MHITLPISCHSDIDGHAADEASLSVVDEFLVSLSDDELANVAGGISSGNGGLAWF